MSEKRCILIGAPMDSGKTRQGCLMGPDAYRTAGIAQMITELGFTVEDRGNVDPGSRHDSAWRCHFARSTSGNGDLAR